jgi:hypothetical protein
MVTQRQPHMYAVTTRVAAPPCEFPLSLYALIFDDLARFPAPAHPVGE